MRRSGASLLFAVLGSVVGTACSSSEERAPFKPTCVENCKVSPPTSHQNVTPEGGAGGGGNASSDGGVRPLTAQLWTLSDRAFTARAAYSGAGTLAVQGPTFAAAADFAGSVAVVPDAEASNILWVAAIPARGTPDVLRTLQTVSGGLPSVDVNIARVSVMNDILAAATQAVVPPTLEPSRSQVVVTFVNGNEIPVRDIEIAEHGGTAIVYDLGNAYTDATGRTGDRGTAVVINADPRPPAAASPFPGSTMVFTYRGVSPPVVGSVVVYAAAGAVTFARVRVTP